MVNLIDLNLKKELIQSQSCFSKLAPEEAEILASLLLEKRFKAGETIVKEGDPVDSFFIIVNGDADVRVNVRFADGIQVKSVAMLSEGQAIGLNESGFYSLTGARTATVVALSDMVLLHLGMAKFHGFALAYPHVSEVMREQARGFLK